MAPSPTGALHLGNALSFLLTWALAKRDGWRVLLRIEDLDTPRTKPWATRQAIDDLRWLGIDWDEGPVTQAGDLEPYREAMQALARAGVVYPCALTRREIESASSAPNEGDHELRFPAELRPTDRPAAFEDEATNWRLVVEPGAVAFREGSGVGTSESDPGSAVGDFPVWTKAGQPSYQLAVTVDDARQGVTQIVRGSDLRDSAARQTLLRRHLGLPGDPVHHHHPLVRGADGRRLAKRHGDTRLSTLRDEGVPVERVVGLVAWWLGAIDRREELRPEQLPGLIRADSIARNDVVLGAEDLSWLSEGDR